MGNFLTYLIEAEVDHYQAGQTALAGGDYTSALKHFRQYAPGKNRRRDAEVAKLVQNLKKRVASNDTSD